MGDTLTAGLCGRKNKPLERCVGRGCSNLLLPSLPSAPVPASTTALAIGFHRATAHRLTRHAVFTHTHIVTRACPCLAGHVDVLLEQSAPRHPELVNRSPSFGRFSSFPLLVSLSLTQFTCRSRTHTSHTYIIHTCIIQISHARSPLLLYRLLQKAPTCRFVVPRLSAPRSRSRAARPRFRSSRNYRSTPRRFSRPCPAC